MTVTVVSVTATAAQLSRVREIQSQPGFVCWLLDVGEWCADERLRLVSGLHQPAGVLYGVYQRGASLIALALWPDGSAVLVGVTGGER